LSIITRFDPWKSKLCTCPPKYTINPYTGCSHNCIYCYATAYIRRNKSVPKKNYLSRVISDLRKINPDLPIDMSLSSDPYPPEELQFNVTRRILEIILPIGFKVQITTKSNIYVRDIDLLSRFNAAVSETITTLDDDLARKLEINAPSPNQRLKSLAKLSDHKVPFSVRIDPIIPYINDDEEELRELVRTVYSLGAKHIVTSTYKAKPDNFRRLINTFPELENKFRKLYYTKKNVYQGYSYLPLNLRKRLLFPVVDEARKLGLTYATCREGLLDKRFFNSTSCDGTHLIPIRMPFKRRFETTLNKLIE